MVDPVRRRGRRRASRRAGAPRPGVRGWGRRRRSWSRRRSRAPCTIESPTAPSPLTTTEAPAGTFAVLSTAPMPVCTAQPTIAAMSVGRSSGMRTAAVGGYDGALGERRQHQAATHGLSLPRQPRRAVGVRAADQAGVRLAQGPLVAHAPVAAAARRRHGEHHRVARRQPSRDRDARRRPPRPRRPPRGRGSRAARCAGRRRGSAGRSGRPRSAGSRRSPRPPAARRAAPRRPPGRRRPRS